jgi:lipopolysaccharide biosynthesis regulator YciM
MLSGSNWNGLGELAAARAELGREDREFELQIVSLRDAEARAPDIAAREEVRQALIATRFHWGALRESRNDPEGALNQYELALARLTSADWAWQRDLSLRAAAVHRARGEHERATALTEALLPPAPEGAERDAVRQALAASHLAWGKALDQAGQPNPAEEQYRKALGQVDKSQWARRYEIVQAIGQIHLNAGATRPLVTLYEGIRPEAPDAATGKQLDEFLGQLYIKWAEEAFRAKKFEFARQRYHHAIGLLPKERWEPRLAAAKKLEEIYGQDKDLKSVTELYAHLVPELPDAKVRREYALYLGRLYWDQAREAEPAQKWLKVADGGEADPVSVEAGYILSEVALAKKQPGQAKSVLESLANRNLDGSTWYVPIHYQLAVLYHRDDKLREALRHYRAVAAAETPDTLKLYPKAIRQSKEQSAQLDQYLKIRGGEAGDQVETPSLKRKPPTPAPKSR